MSSSWTLEEKWHKDRKASSQFHLHPLNLILQDILKEKTDATLWLKPEKLCIMKSLTSKMHLKQQLYSLRISEGTSFEYHLIAFKKIDSNLEVLGVKYEEDSMRKMI